MHVSIYLYAIKVINTYKITLAITKIFFPRLVSLSTTHSPSVHSRIISPRAHGICLSHWTLTLHCFSNSWSHNFWWKSSKITFIFSSTLRVSRKFSFSTMLSLTPSTLLDPFALVSSITHNRIVGRVSKPLYISTSIWGKKQAEDKASFPPYTYYGKIGHPFEKFLKEFGKNKWAQEITISTPLDLPFSPQMIQMTITTT